MKKFAGYMALILAVTAAFAGCEKENTDSSQSVPVETTTSAAVAETTTTVSEETPVETTTEIPSEAAEPVQTVGNTEYRPVLDAYHQAYIDGNAETIYSLFSPDEIAAFDTYMKAYLKENAGESEITVEKMFAKDNVVSAINGSINNIHSIMSTYNESDTDTWSINIDETTIERYTAEELAEINKSLNMNITDGYICEIPFYKNNVNDEIFVAEPASVLQIDGSWYISYSAACDRLIEFMDIEF